LETSEALVKGLIRRDTAVYVSLSSRTSPRPPGFPAHRRGVSRSGDKAGGVCSIRAC